MGHKKVIWKGNNPLLQYLGGEFKYLWFSLLLGEIIKFDSFFVRWVETTNQVWLKSPIDFLKIIHDHVENLL